MYRCIAPGAVELYDNDPQRHIELIGRVCYRSEDKITEDSDKKFIANLHERGHWAMLEHYRFIMKVSSEIYDRLFAIHSPYVAMTRTLMGYRMGHPEYRHIISASARALMDILHSTDSAIVNNIMNHNTIVEIIEHIIWHHGCKQLFGGAYTPHEHCDSDITIIDRNDMNRLWYNENEVMAHCWHSVKFTCDRGVTHELVRHRPVSFAQESTRYCNYTNGKFDSSIGVIRPFEFKPDTEQYIIWDKCMHYLNEMYTQLIHAGASPQWARSVLPQSTKADIVMTCTMDEWQHIINLRYLGTTGKPHPQMVEIMTDLINKCDWAKSLADR